MKKEKNMIQGPCFLVRKLRDQEEITQSQNKLEGRFFPRSGAQAG
jgi:hypothetical protein